MGGAQAELRQKWRTPTSKSAQLLSAKLSNDDAGLMG